MSSKEAISDFLHGTFGYGKILEFVSKQKPGEIDLREHLKGTILGTFKKSGISVYPNKTVWKQKYITVPRIYQAADMEEEIKNNKHYLSEEKVAPEIRARGHFLSSGNAFGRTKGVDVRKIVKRIHSEEFPEAECDFRIIGSIKGFIRNDDFFFYTQGSNLRNEYKFIVVSFNLPDDVVSGLNSIGERYMAIMRRLYQE